MAIKPVNFEHIVSHKASADKTSADVVISRESDSSKKNISTQKLVIHEQLNKRVIAQTDILTRTVSGDLIALPVLQERILSILHAFSIQPSPLAQQAVLLAISEGLKLSPSLIRKIIHVLENEIHRDALTVIRALDDTDSDLFFKALELLTRIRSLGQHNYEDGHTNHGQQGEHNEGQTQFKKQAMIAETEEKHAIISQFKALVSECFRATEQEKNHAGHTTTNTSQTNGRYASHFTWIHVPFSFIEGSLNLTGYLRMVYNYYTKKIERMVVECTDEQAERLAVLEAGKVLFWSSNKKECTSAEQQGLVCISQKEVIQACALCGINAGIGAGYEKEQ